jgi:type II secretory pathway pseudopilin PulG
MFKKFHKQKNGVMSLIEIIVIVTVLSILVAASIVNFSAAKNRAEIRRCASSLHNIRQCIKAYWIEKEYYPPTAVVTDFSTLYTELSSSGMDFNPEEDFSGWISYEGDFDFYTLVVRSHGRSQLLLTATPNGIDCGEYQELCEIR